MYTQLVGAALADAELEVERRGACSTAPDPDRWFPPTGSHVGSTQLQARQRREAEFLCSGCPVIDLCAQTAISRGEQHGIWGGMPEYRVFLESRAHSAYWKAQRADAARAERRAA